LNDANRHSISRRSATLNISKISHFHWNVPPTFDGIAQTIHPGPFSYNRALFDDANREDAYADVHEDADQDSKADVYEDANEDAKNDAYNDGNEDGYGDGSEDGYAVDSLYIAVVTDSVMYYINDKDVVYNN
jgi:flagellar biosynthesis/type III secretory pathway protein FliH